MPDLWCFCGVDSVCARAAARPCGGEAVSPAAGGQGLRPAPPPAPPPGARAATPAALRGLAGVDVLGVS